MNCNFQTQLPSGWEEVPDPEGRPMYRKFGTNNVQYERPIAEVCFNIVYKFAIYHAANPGISLSDDFVFGNHRL